MASWYAVTVRVAVFAYTVALYRMVLVTVVVGALMKMVGVVVTVVRPEVVVGWSIVNQVMAVVQRTEDGYEVARVVTCPGMGVYVPVYSVTVEGGMELELVHTVTGQDAVATVDSAVCTEVSVGRVVVCRPKVTTVLVSTVMVTGLAVTVEVAGTVASGFVDVE